MSGIGSECGNLLLLAVFQNLFCRLSALYIAAGFVVSASIGDWLGAGSAIRKADRLGAASCSEVGCRQRIARIAQAANRSNCQSEQLPIGATANRSNCQSEQLAIGVISESAVKMAFLLKGISKLCETSKTIAQTLTSI
ncbi:Hypothetical protein HDN1F_30530 [gamma proteobacterium HdN1]|nr:Hypothetical protein HDN1F_30530 [gamma proteobacterium HdN1]